MSTIRRMVDLFERQVAAFEGQSRAIQATSEAQIRHLNSVAAVNERNARMAAELDAALKTLRTDVAELQARLATPPSSNAMEKK